MTKIVRLVIRVAAWAGIAVAVGAALRRRLRSEPAIPMPPVEFPPVPAATKVHSPTPASEPKPAQEPAQDIEADVEPEPAQEPAQDIEADVEPEPEPPAVGARSRRPRPAPATPPRKSVVRAVPVARPTERTKSPSSWVEPVGTTCPPSHQVKAKNRSKVYYLPSSPSYERTAPDRCYLDAASAEADGYRPAKR